MPATDPNEEPRVAKTVAMGAQAKTQAMAAPSSAAPQQGLSPWLFGAAVTGVLLIGGAIAAVVLVSLNDDNAPEASEPPQERVCEPGATRVCVCPGNAGAQSCGDDGSRWRECVCPEPSAPSNSEGIAAPAEEPEAEPSGNSEGPDPGPRGLREIVANPTPHDVTERFVWAATRDPNAWRAQLHCADTAVEAARRGSRMTRSPGRHLRCADSGPLGASCHDDRPGHQARPTVFFERDPGGRYRLIGFWNGMLGDANRAQIEQLRGALRCGEVRDLSTQ